jgi:hypothetical protein
MTAHPKEKFSMTVKRWAAVLFFAGAGAVFAAESKLEAVLGEAVKAPKQAAAIVAAASGQSPKLIGPLVSAAVTALPEQAVEIFAAVLAAVPEQYPAIVRAAVLAQPALATDFASVGAATLPDRAREIVQLAIDAAPEEARGSLAALLKPSFLDRVRSRAGRFRGSPCRRSWSALRAERGRIRAPLTRAATVRQGNDRRASFQASSRATSLATAGPGGTAGGAGPG